MKKYDSYKESEIEYISEIPIHWKVKPLYTLFNEVKDKNKGNLESNVLSLSYGNIKKRNIESNMGLLPDSFETYNRIKKDDIVLRLTDLQNDKKSLRTGLVREKGIITSAYVTLRKRNENINAEYAHWLLHAFDVKKVFYNLGAGVRQSMGYSELKKMNLILPPRTEQKKIVDYLQHKISDIDKLVENLNVLINKLEQQRQSIITEAVAKGLNLNVKMKESGVEWIGEIPEHWYIKKLKYLLREGSEGIKIGPFGSALKLEMMVDEGYKVYGQENLIKDDFTLGKRFINSNLFSELSNYALKEGDVLVSMMGTIGKCKVVPNNFQKGIMDSHLIRMRFVKNKINSNYIALVISNAQYIKEQFNLNSKGSIMSGLNSSIIKSLDIVLPPLEEQNEILEYLMRTLNQIDYVSDSITQQISKLKEYRQSLIYEAVTGKIDVRDMELD